jgi:hypothetical protein
MNNSLNTLENSLVIVMAYDLYQYQKLSEDLINFVEAKLRKKWKIGAATLNPNQKLKMKACSRDMPDRDLENLILAAKEDTKKESIYDVMINSINYFEDEQDHTKRTMLIIICELSGYGCCAASDLVLLRDNGIKLYVLTKEGVLTGDEFLEQMSKIGAMVIPFGNELPFKKALSNVYDSMKNQ